MSQSIYDVSVVSFERALRNLKAVLEKARAHAEAEKIDPSVLLNLRLYPDMLPLKTQVQIASDNAKGCVARLAQQDPPSFADSETSFAELQDRLDRTLKYIKEVTPRQLEGAGERAVELKFPHRTFSFKSGWDYLLTFALPNVFFHCTTAYAILRHAGVKLGKADFLGSLG